VFLITLGLLNKMYTDATVIILCIVLISLAFHSWKRKRSSSNQKLKEIKDKLIRVDPRAQNVEFYIDPEESYTLDKKEVYMCVHDPTGGYYNDDTLMYIALHELAHALIPEDTSKHPPKFDALFNQLKDRAAYLKLYNPETPFPNEYCGKKLSYY
jgi:hypothetical protein